MSGLFFYSMSSGSNGNCYYLGTEKYGILIDVGISQRRITKLLDVINVKLDNIFGILLTHAHADHVRGANSISTRLHLPFYATKETFSLISSGYRSQYEVQNIDQHIISPGQMFEIGEFKITAFEVPHDVYCVGYKIGFRGKNMVIVTDAGNPTQEIKKEIGDANYLILEANYDVDMLQSGPYPYALKQRIAGGDGHLSNTQAAKLVEECAREKLERLFLCHLSAHNNTPDLVRKTFGDSKLPQDRIQVLPRTQPSTYTEL